MFYLIAANFQADKSIQAKPGHLLYNKMYNWAQVKLYVPETLS